MSFVLWLADALCRGFASASALQSAFGLSLVAAGSALDMILWIFSPPLYRTSLAASMPRIWPAKGFSAFNVLFKGRDVDPGGSLRGYGIASYIAVDVSIVLASARDAVMTG